jgi:hypothetical protein
LCHLTIILPTPLTIQFDPSPSIIRPASIPTAAWHVTSLHHYIPLVSTTLFHPAIFPDLR